MSSSPFMGMSDASIDILFYTLCVTVRLTVAILLYTYNYSSSDTSLSFASRGGSNGGGGSVNGFMMYGLPIIFIVMSFGFMYQWVKMADSGFKSGTAWWQFARPMHAFNWLLTALFIFNAKFKHAGIVVFVDLIIGVFLKLVYSQTLKLE